MTGLETDDDDDDDDVNKSRCDHVGGWVHVASKCLQPPRDEAQCSASFFPLHS